MEHEEDPLPGREDPLPGNAVGPLQITEEDVQESAPRVRALMVARLEAMWEPVRVRLQGDAGGAPIDPRLLEIGLRIVKEEATLYRLFRAPVTKQDEEELEQPGFDRIPELMRQVSDIEARIKDVRQPDASG